MTLGHLKSPEKLNFSGWVLSDWGGVHSTIASAFAGLDQEMPGSAFFGDALAAAVASGAVPESLIDDKVVRILTPMFAQGLFDIPPSGSADSNATSPRHAALARTIAAAGTVLLSNSGVLPLSDDVRNIVVVGAAADLTPYCCGAGSGGLSPPYVVTPLAGIRARAGAGVNVSYAPVDAPWQNLTSWYSSSRGDHFLDFACDECGGLYDAVRAEGLASPQPCAARDAPCVALQLWYNAANASNLVIVDGLFSPPAGYVFVRALAYALPLNYSGALPTRVLELWSGADAPAGAPPRSHLDFWTLATDASRADAAARGYARVAELARLPLAPPAPPPPPPAVDGVVVIVVSTPSSEGRDRASLNLSAADDALIAAWATSNPNRTIVVVNNPGAVVMPWSGAAAAILAAW